MPPIRSARNRKPPPDGFDDIEDTLLEFSNKMKDAENASHEGKKRHEVLWPIFQISHQRGYLFSVAIRPFPSPTFKDWLLILMGRVGSRYIYELYYDKDAMSKTLYDWLLKNGYADGNLIAKWKKQGYEKACAPIDTSVFTEPLTMAYTQLCCLRCIQTKETNFNATCICRVPKAQLKEEQTIECVACGCRGCSSSD